MCRRRETRHVPTTRQLLDYLYAADQMPDLQSAYRANHSTETAILKALADIIRAV